MSKSSVSMKVWVLLERYFKQNYALKTKKFSSSTLTTVLKRSTQCDWPMYNLYFKPYFMSQFFIFHNQCPHTYIFQNSLLIFFPEDGLLVDGLVFFLYRLLLYFCRRWTCTFLRDEMKSMKMKKEKKKQEEKIAPGFGADLWP